MKNDTLIDQIKTGMIFDVSLTFKEDVRRIAERCQEILLDYFTSNNLDYDYEVKMSEDQFGFDSEKNPQFFMTDSQISFSKTNVRDFVSLATHLSKLYSIMRQEFWQKKRMKYLGVILGKSFELKTPSSKEFLMNHYCTPDLIKLLTADPKAFKEFLVGAVYDEENQVYTASLRLETDKILRLDIDVRSENSDLDILDFLRGSHDYFVKKEKLLRALNNG